MADGYKSQSAEIDAKDTRDTVELNTHSEGKHLGYTPTSASEQDAEIAPKLQVKAMLAVAASAVYWIIQVFSLLGLAAYGRNITSDAALGEPGKAAWLINSYNVVTIVAAPILSYTADQYGRKWCIVAPLTLGAVGAVIASRAHSMNVLIVGCAFIGLGGSPLGITTAVPSEVVPHRHRTIAQAIVFSVSSFGAIPALLGMSKAITVDPVNGWRWIFYTLIIGFGFEAILWTLVYNPPPRKTSLTRDRPSLDYVGYALLAVATSLFLCGTTWGGSTYPWRSAQVLGTLIPGIFLYVVFAAWEWKGRRDGLLHHDLFKDRNFPLTVIAITIEGFIFLTLFALTPGELATVYVNDAFKAGQYGLIFWGAQLFALPIGGLYASKTRDIITPIIVGYTLLVGAIIGFIFCRPDTSGLFYGMDALAGLGLSQPLTYLTVAAQFAAPPELIALSTAIVLSARALGGAIGTAITSTVLSSKENEKIPSYIAAATLPLGLNPQLLGPVIGAATGDVALIEAILQGKINGVTPQIFLAAAAAAKQAFSDSYHWAWITVLPFAIIGTLSILLLNRNKHKLDYIM